MTDSRTARGLFQTTQWSTVLAAGDLASPDAHEALEVLCSSYWRPLYVYARSRGRPREEAEDLVQGFFCRMLSHNDLGRADPLRGRFRTFLLTAFQRYMANEWDRARARKRGRGVEHVPLNFSDAEERWLRAAAADANPERIYQRQWALDILESTMRTLRAEYLHTGRDVLFDVLKPTLTGGHAQKPYSELGAALGMSEGAVKTAVHRMRSRYKTLLQEAMADTVDDDRCIEEEIRDLISALGG